MKKLTKGGFGELPKLSALTIFAMTFGYFGINTASSLQWSQMARVFQTLGANPTHLSYYFLLPPIIGMVVQPLIGKYSDHTWCKMGRRVPYLLLGMIIGVAVLALFPNAGSLGFTPGSVAVLSIGLAAIAFIDVSNNICMQPFKMIIGDMVNDKQQDKAWSWQQIFGSLGNLVGSILPFAIAAIGLSNVAPKGQVPITVKLAFYIAAFVLMATMLYSCFAIKEYNPKDYAYYHGLSEAQVAKKTPLWTLVLHAPKAFWEICLVQFFSWISFTYMNTYGVGALAKNVWHVANPTSAGYQAAGNWNGVLGIGASVAGMIFGWLVLSKAKPQQRKFMYSLGLILGGLGMVMFFFVHGKYLMFIPFALYGIGGITLSVEPFNLLTEALSGHHEGAYMGLFNCGICAPQIVAAIVGGYLMDMVHGSMPMMILVAGVAMIFAAFLVRCIHTGGGSDVKKAA